MSTPMPNGCEILNNPNATFDDVKHILYSGVKYVVFDLDGYEEDSSLYKLYKYSKERFPDKVFDNIIEVAEIAENKEKADSKASAIPFSEFKLNSDGLIPCIAQDYRTGEVLMMAYMNEDSYNKTLQTGLMTYWTRSRQRLWTKGEESGHFQKVISLTIDCDKDTILAKVDQTGPACHTGNPTCFFTPLTESAEASDADKKDIYKVLQDVYSVIADRKINPREGSYTNYLFDKGIDKILKKVGEECTEIVIASKNPDPKEIKYEIADFLYHAMVLMVERGVTWEEIAEELANRE
jgi:phosphoribosyl-ATP pyrophosphohydrolase/phosphoribosyl-AMP cyclohydrolase